ncbi:MAG: GAF domain-containing protein [Deltaproteobacteria bacterium]|nr:GAF domain-containing protein [Deltaproteobacteria bacterium]
MNFLPMLGVEIYPFGTIGIIVSLSVMSYSIVKHRLMDVGVFMSKGLGYVLSIVILGVPAIVGIFFLERYFFQQEDLSFSLILLAIGVLVALSFNNVKERIDRAMHQIIVRDKYFYHRILEEFSRRLVTMVDLNRLLHMLAETVERSMGVWRISIFLYDQEKEVFHPALVRGSPEMGVKDLSFKSDDDWIRYLHDKKEAILRAELERNPKNPEREELFPAMGRLQAEVCLPLVYLDRLIGFINLGHKAGEEMYYREDLDLLNSLANQVAIAIENANLYENLKKSQNIMRRADRLASLGTLIASLAHEIRNPLVSIKTFTQLLPERLEDEEFRNYFLKIASGEIDRLTTLINELLGFARPSEPNLQGEDVNTLIDKMEFLISTEARKKNIAISKYYAPNLPPVMVDAEQIKQVLLNILLNAIQAISGRGQICVETRVVQVPREETSERFVQIEVRDSGGGIPKENLERVFDPFFSTRPDGSGLGLAISHQIIHEHGGFIDLESEVGKGTSFRIHLPLKNGRRGGPGK